MRALPRWRSPYGVIAAILSWNGPIGSIAMKVPAALAAANTVVIKPPEVAPFGSEVFIDLLRRAGFRPASSTSYPGTPRRGGL